MGSNIYAYIEYIFDRKLKQPEVYKQETLDYHYFATLEIYRSRTLFDCLSGTGKYVAPVVRSRGIPDNMSYAIEYAYRHDRYGREIDTIRAWKRPSWLVLPELQEIKSKYASKLPSPENKYLDIIISIMEHLDNPPYTTARFVFWFTRWQLMKFEPVPETQEESSDILKDFFGND